MKMSKTFQPILLSGMHRSGTSMVTKILKDFSLEIGHKLDDNNESLFFQRINIWMMSLMGSSWDNPQSFNSINDNIKDDIVYQLQKLIDSRANSLYFGWSSVIKNKSFSDIEKPWGWKDPRNVFTQNIWRQVFPDIKMVQIIRHPVDIAVSLMKRQKKEIKSDILRKKKSSNVIKALLSISHSNYNSSMILNSYNDCFKLIEIYFDEITRNPSSNSLLIKFEDILSNPEFEIGSLLDFCSIPYNPEQLSEIISTIDPTKGFSYKANVEYLDLEDQAKDLINKMGY
ncbi:MAG: hypothetical protein CMG26_07055 [Candidatus Marinimicrobia bacterium]|nr:hypothetical protein [Candidatus Neomarinimicrobiota bacterium]